MLQVVVEIDGDQAEVDTIRRNGFTLSKSGAGFRLMSGAVSLTSGKVSVGFNDVNRRSANGECQVTARTG